MADLAGRRKLELQVSRFQCRYGGREPAVMSSVASQAGLIHLGMDTSKNAIVVATLLPGEDSPATDRIANEEAAIRRLVGRFADRSVLGPGMRPGREVMSCTGCWPRWGWRARWWRRR